MTSSCRGWLNNVVENGTYTPGPCKLYSLGAIYRTHWTNLFAFYGLHLSDFERDQAMFAPPKTQLAPDSLEAEENDRRSRAVPRGVAAGPDESFSKLADIWGEAGSGPIDPAANGFAKRHLRLRGHERQPNVASHPAGFDCADRSESAKDFERQMGKRIRQANLFFGTSRWVSVQLVREIGGGYLSAIPHPNSKCEVRRSAYPREADIVGWVAVTNRLAASI